MELLNNIRILDLIDIIIVSVFIYYGLLWFHSSRAFQLFKGFMFIAIFFFLSKWLQLYTISWVLHKVAAILVILLIIVFQPELRKALEQLGRHSIFSTLLGPVQGKDIAFLPEVLRSVDEMAERKIGSIIVIARSTGLSDYIESGLEIDALVREDLITSVFQKNSPLHDGAMIIQGGRVSAVSCLLPLSDNKQLDTKLGTRHRAALGISELSDAIVIVVSEETGIISVAENGVLTRYLSRQDLEERLLVLDQSQKRDVLGIIRGFFSEQLRKKT